MQGSGSDDEAGEHKEPSFVHKGALWSYTVGPRELSVLWSNIPNIPNVSDASNRPQNDRAIVAASMLLLSLGSVSSLQAWAVKDAIIAFSIFVACLP